ncbi:MAG: hypothetical protein C3F12_00965 [Candidatus Methylomirabilota bacterium]|nr:MAG: hypothetical protein C3F12_00965 [candidate division NC10 bacterium]
MIERHTGLPLTPYASRLTPHGFGGGKVRMGGIRLMIGLLTPHASRDDMMEHLNIDLLSPCGRGRR